MNLASALLYPFLMLLPAASTGDSSSASGHVDGPAPLRLGESGFTFWPGFALDEFGDWPQGGTMLSVALPQDAEQFRIEQRMIIRITPRASLPVPDMFTSMPDGTPQFVERKIGKCLSIAGIASVRPQRANRLLLFMRDNRVVSAELDRSCRARDFYSGFLLEDIPDGRLCVDRDTLLSRSGMNCKLTRIRELVEQDH